MGYCRWAPAMLPRAPSKVSAGTGAGVPLTSTSQPRCQWEEGTQGECRPPECAAGQPLSGSITRGVRATRRAHLRALPSAMRRKPPLVLLHSLGFPRNLAWICIRGVSQCDRKIHTVCVFHGLFFFHTCLYERHQCRCLLNYTTLTTHRRYKLFLSCCVCAAGGRVRTGGVEARAV